MIDIVNIFNIKGVNKTIAIISVPVIVGCTIKEKDFELHSLEFFHQDKFISNPSATGTYSPIAIGGKWLFEGGNPLAQLSEYFETHHLL